MDIRIIRHNSPDYEAMVALRFDVLRKPLRLSFSPEALEKEKEDILIGAFEGNELVGCCILSKVSKGEEAALQLRQMAVRTDLQGGGIGGLLLRFAEEETGAAGFTRLMMHARDAAIPFYQKCGYAVSGPPFTEVGIPHHLMEKHLGG